MSAPLVLVHGGGHGAWCWERTLAELTTPAQAVDLPPVSIRGGPDRQGSPSDLDSFTIADWAESVLAAAMGAGWDRFVLVGHSLGGATIAEVARRAPDRVAHLVYVSAVVPEDGGTVLEMLPPELLTRMAGGLTEDVVREVFGNDMDEDQIGFVLDHVGTEVFGVLTETVIRKGTPPGLPVTYVRLARDNALPPAVQDGCIARLRQESEAVAVVDLDAGHDVMISRPDQLAAVLDAIAAAAS